MTVFVFVVVYCSGPEDEDTDISCGHVIAKKIFGAVLSNYVLNFLEILREGSGNEISKVFVFIFVLRNHGYQEVCSSLHHIRCNVIDLINFEAEHSIISLGVEVFTVLSSEFLSNISEDGFGLAQHFTIVKS